MTALDDHSSSNNRDDDRNSDDREGASFPDASHDDHRGVRDVTQEGLRVPRANKGRSTPADSLHNSTLKVALTEFNDAYCARGAGEAQMIRALSTAYDIAWARARASISDPTTAVRGGEEQVFSWHFTSVLGEFAVASHDSDTALRNRAFDAHRLVHDFPEWVTAVETGRVDMRHVHVLLKHARILDSAHFAEYGAQVLEYASVNTPRKTGDFAERAAGTVAAEAFDAAHERARAERHVTIAHDGVGMALLTAYLPSEIAAPIGQLLDKQARALRALDAAASAENRQGSRAVDTEFVPDSRTHAQIRADVFAETLLCATPGESRVTAVVSITVPALSLLRDRVDGTEPALLDGMTPMSFTEARQLAGQAHALQRVLTHPVTGQVTGVDSYSPDRGLRRYLQVRDRTCQHPGCARPATLAETDHTTPYRDGGETNTRNLAHLCKGHHVQKHEKPWTVTNLGGGTLQWRTPLGQLVTTAPEPPGPRFTPTSSGRHSDGTSDSAATSASAWASPDGATIVLDDPGNSPPDPGKAPPDPGKTPPDHRPGHRFSHDGLGEFSDAQFSDPQFRDPRNSADGSPDGRWWPKDRPPIENADEPPPF